MTNSWPHLFVCPFRDLATLKYLQPNFQAARFVLGLGIGPKSATVPVYAAECAPPAIRGALVMMWQTWTAFGIMFGYLVDVAFEKVPDQSGITGLNWRLMLGSVSTLRCRLYPPH